MAEAKSKVLGAIALFEQKAKENAPIIQEINRRNMRHRGTVSQQAQANQKEKRSSIELNEEIVTTISQSNQNVVNNKRHSLYQDPSKPLSSYERPFMSPPPQRPPPSIPPSNNDSSVKSTRSQPLVRPLPLPVSKKTSTETPAPVVAKPQAPVKPSVPSPAPPKSPPHQSEPQRAPPGAPLPKIISPDPSSAPGSRPQPPASLNLSAIRTIPQAPQQQTQVQQQPPPIQRTSGSLSPVSTLQQPPPMPKVPPSKNVSNSEIKSPGMERKISPAQIIVPPQVKKTGETKPQEKDANQAKKPGILPFKKPPLPFQPGGPGRRPKQMEDRLTRHLKELQNDYGVSTRALFLSLIGPETEKALSAAPSSSTEKVDQWSSKPEEKRDWKEVEAVANTVAPEIRNLLNIDRSQAEGFHFEFGRNKVIYSQNVDIERKESNIPFYTEYLHGKDNIVYYFGKGAGGEGVGPVCVVFEGQPKSETDARAIIMTKKGNTRILIPFKSASSTKEIWKFIKTEYKDLLGDTKLTRVKDMSVLPSKLLEFEKQDIVTRYKFGLLYVRDGQTDENVMFSNGGEDTPSEDYEEFLAFIGEKIVLEGWSKFRGGLDVKTNFTGTHSVYTEFRGFEIMFHVSTLLPYQPNDLQRVERKRHLGNDIVVLVFKEGNTPFDPLCLTSHFNHIFVVIQPVKVNGKTQYRLSIANKTGVPVYGPFLKSPPVYEKNNQFRELLLTKLINSERAAMLAPDFKGKMMRTRKTLLESYADELSGSSKSKKPSKIVSSPKEKDEAPAATKVPVSKLGAISPSTDRIPANISPSPPTPANQTSNQETPQTPTPAPAQETPQTSTQEEAYEKGGEGEQYNEEEYYDEEYYDEYNEYNEYDEYNEYEEGEESFYEQQ